jgi:hypothetical protein
LSQGNRVVIAMMQRDQQRFKDTGRWAFEAFKGSDPNQRLVTAMAARVLHPPCGADSD